MSTSLYIVIKPNSEVFRKLIPVGLLYIVSIAYDWLELWLNSTLLANMSKYAVS